MNTTVLKTIAFVLATLHATCFFVVSSTYNVPSNIAEQTLLDLDLIATYGVLNLSSVDTLLFNNTTSFTFRRDTILGNGSAINLPYRDLVFEGGANRPDWSVYGSPRYNLAPLELEFHSISIKNAKWHVIDKSLTSASQFYIKQIILGDSGVGTPSYIKLENAEFVVDPTTSTAFSSTAYLSVKGVGNRIQVSELEASNVLPFSLILEPNADLEIFNGTFLNAMTTGNLNMQPGSSLYIVDSKVLLTKYHQNVLKGISDPSIIDGATVALKGSYASDAVSLELTNPTIRNSTITLNNNTEFRSYDVTPSGYVFGAVHFEGDNTISLGDGSLFTANTNKVPTTTDGEFFFKNGHTDVTGSINSDFKASLWALENASVSMGTFRAHEYINVLTLSNNSKMDNKNYNLDSLIYLTVNDSELSGEVSYGAGMTILMGFKNATINQTQASNTAGKGFEANQFIFSGNNTFNLRMQPGGKVIDPNFPSFITYNDSITFRRGAVFGLSSIKFNLESFKAGQSADAYAKGGDNTDGVYDLSYFIKGATSDSDVATISLGGSMPALLKCSQVASPGADRKVSVKLETQPVASLLTHPSITTPNQKNAVMLLTNSSTAGNARTQSALGLITNDQLQAHSDSIHAEPFSSYMTVSLEQADRVMNTVLSHASEGNVTTGTSQRVVEDAGRRLWLDASYSDGDIDGDDGLGDFGYTLSGLTLGYDFVTTSSSVLGGYASFGYQKMDEHDTADQSFDGESYHVGAYLYKQFNHDLEMKGLVGYSYGTNSSKRWVTLGDTKATPSADYDSHTTYAGLMASMLGYQNGWVCLRPEIGINYTYYTQESFEESGDPDFSLKVDSANAQAIVASAGLNARFGSLFRTKRIYPMGFVRYEHDFYANQNNAHDMDAALVSHPDFKQSFAGQNRGENTILTGVGIGSDMTDNFNISGGIVMARHSHGKEWGAGVNMEYRWSGW
ncbi:autotransporter family protein [Desulfoluna spongiiphila]|uniref:Autotransporter beta-domain-containing protein n=1 Tax=Desulfoluna spongiiphila TaxID=419481 RepID=A0A1G5FH46_9BACT|nr:autotransporter outer membrane beta-barrel domain-containing protein [Desulfoluna spongiiphila]SCY38461.1 Autotransporter beta-domain-containing protein [Desulfoluna spongiiphila]